MKELQKACLPQHLLCCSRQAFCCFKRYKGIANYFIFLIIASVKALQPRVPPSSPVICPDAKQAAMASSMRCPSSFMPKCFSIMAEDIIGMKEEGQRIEDAIAACFASGQMTGELGGTLGCKAFTEAIIKNMK